MKNPEPGEGRPPTPDIYRWWGTRIEWAQAAFGVLLFAAALVAWRELGWRLPVATENRAARWGVQAGLVVGLGLLLLAADAVASRRWGWYQLRVGIVMGLFASAGFWMVRAAMGVLARVGGH